MSSNAKRFTKYGTASAVNGAFWYLAHGAKGGSVRTPMGNVPVWAVGAGLGLAGAMASDLAHHAILPHLSANKKFEHVESAVLAPVASAGANVLGAMALNPALIQEAGGTTEFAVLAGVSELASEWIWSNTILPFVDPNYVDAVSF